MLIGVVIYSVMITSLSLYQSHITRLEFQSMQENQFSFIGLADQIKTKLALLQNLQVQQVVDNIMEVDNEGEEIDLLLPSILKDLAKLKKFAKKNESKEILVILENINLRYSMLVGNNIELDLESIKEDNYEGFETIESMVAIAGKMNEELTNLISLSHSQLESAIESFYVDMDMRNKTIITIGIVSLVIFLFGGILFLRSISKRINLLVGGTKAFSQNEFGYRIPNLKDECQDELCDLADSFNGMAASIEDLVEQQQRSNEMLDHKVKEQTKEIRKNLTQLEKTNMIVMDSINYASKIQHSFLPNSDKINNALGEHFIIWNQRDIVGGDFYWLEELEDGFIVALIDCTGHGVPGSLMTMIAVPTLDRIIREHCIIEPALILGSLNRQLKSMLDNAGDELGDDGLDAGICYVNTKEGYLKFAGAGIPLFYTRDGEIFEIKAERKGVGYKKTSLDHEFLQERIEIDTKMSFYMATDGITEQVGGVKRRMMFGKKRLRELLKEIHIKAKHEQREIILETLSQYRGNEPQKDDMTCISFKIQSKEKNNEH